MVRGIESSVAELGWAERRAGFSPSALGRTILRIVDLLPAWSYDSGLPEPSGVFQPDFLIAIRALVNVHHSIYAQLPPQGNYFEALVEEAFRWVKRPFTPVGRTGGNLAGPDLIVEDRKVSLKTETGLSTHPWLINITKLCTTEKDPWEARALIERVLAHLSRYDIILMLRAIWERPLIHYQLLEIAIDTLRLMASAEFRAVGRRTGRRSFGADVLREGEPIFHVHFDGSDGKCQIRGLRVQDCVMLLEWDVVISEPYSHLPDLRKTNQ
jgi:Type II site-specific deoxyribonuclease